MAIGIQLNKMDDRLNTYITQETKNDLELLNGKSIPDEVALYVIIRKKGCNHIKAYSRIKELWRGQK